MVKERKVKLSELDDVQLILQFQIATRKSWVIFLKKPREIALKTTEHCEELRIKREVIRRLKYESIRGSARAKTLLQGDKFIFLEASLQRTPVVYVCAGRSEGGEIDACEVKTGLWTTFHPDHYIFKLIL